jgi:hypothetical protein
MHLHAATTADGRDRKQQGRLCRYLRRPPFAHDAVRALPGGRVRVDFKAAWRSGAAKGVDAYTPVGGTDVDHAYQHSLRPACLESLYHKAETAQPTFAGYFKNKRWGTKRLNIINVDFIGEIDWAKPSHRRGRQSNSPAQGRPRDR